jgi:ubiquinone/menaquinone biosynthesis C-methylase UbiE
VYGEAARRALAEAFRVLRPGGRFTSAFVRARKPA